MKRQPIMRVLVAMGMVCMFVSSAFAQTQLTPAEIERRLRELARKAQASEFPQGLTCKIEVKFLGPAKGELEALRAEVEGKPDHPRRPDLAIAERIARDGSLSTSYSVRYWDKNLWRVDSHAPYLGLSADSSHALNDNAQWTLSGSSLSLEDPLWLPNGPAWTKVQSVGQAMSSVVHLGMWDVPFSAAASVQHTAIDGGKFVLRVQLKDDVALEIEGQSDGTTLEVSQVRSLNAPNYRLLLRLEEYFDDPVLGRVPAMVRGSLNDRKWECRALAAGILPKSEIARYAATPDPLGSDPVLGQLELQTVTDRRSNKQVHSSKSPDGWKDTSLAPVPTQSQRSTRTIGWAAAGVLIASLVVLRLRRLSA